MNLQPYMGHAAPGRLKRPGPLPLDTLEYKMRAAVVDDGGLLVDGAEAINTLRKQLSAADARVKILEAELIATRALVDERKVA